MEHKLPRVYIRDHKASIVINSCKKFAFGIESEAHVFSWCWQDEIRVYCYFVNVPLCTDDRHAAFLASPKLLQSTKWYSKFVAEEQRAAKFLLELYASSPSPNSFK